MQEIKLKTISHDDIKLLDHVYTKVDIEIVRDQDKLFDIDDRIPVLNRYRVDLLECVDKIKKYLSNTANKFILLDDWEGTNTVIRFLRINDLISFCETKQLQIISSGDMPQDWKYANIDYFISLTGSIFNQIVATNSDEKMYDPSVKPYKFLFLNKQTDNRPHRSKLIKLLNRKGLLESALWSDLCQQITIPKHYKDYFNQEITEISINQTAHDLSWPDGVLNMPLLTDTYFSVVTETNYEYPMRYFTEKIYKPILARHPFIAVSCKGFYRQLHQQGYQTFSKFIDESFDNINDSNERLEKIADSIEQLCNSDLVKFQQGVKDICRHNQQVYLEKVGRHSLTMYNELTNFLGKVNAKKA